MRLGNSALVVLRRLRFTFNARECKANSSQLNLQDVTCAKTTNLLCLRSSFVCALLRGFALSLRALLNFDSAQRSFIQRNEIKSNNKQATQTNYSPKQRQQNRVVNSVLASRGQRLFCNQLCLRHASSLICFNRTICAREAYSKVRLYRALIKRRFLQVHSRVSH